MMVMVPSNWKRDGKKWDRRTYVVNWFGGMDKFQVFFCGQKWPVCWKAIKCTNNQARKLNDKSMSGLECSKTTSHGTKAHVLRHTTQIHNKIYTNWMWGARSVLRYTFHIDKCWERADTHTRSLTHTHTRFNNKRLNDKSLDWKLRGIDDCREHRQHPPRQAFCWSCCHWRSVCITYLCGWRCFRLSGKSRLVSVSISSDTSYINSLLPCISLCKW